MFIFNTSFLLYVMFFLSVMFLVLYAWRRLYGLEKYTNILEKKISNLKKENKGLQEMLQGTDDTTFEKADVIMNSIFKCDPRDKCFVGEDHSCPTYEPDHTEDPVKIEYIDEVLDLAGPMRNANPLQEEEAGAGQGAGVGAGSVPDMPVAEHMEMADADVESVISESNVFNKKKLNKMNLDKIKDICSAIGVSTDGTKNVLIERILAQ